MNKARNAKPFVLFFIFSILCFISNAQSPTFSITVNNSSVTSACIGSTIQFTNTSVNQNDIFYWIVEGTKIKSASNSIIYVFKTAGTFPIQLVDSSKNLSTTTQLIIHNLPVASFNVSNSEICQGNSVNFTSTSTSSSNIISYNWNFGDDAQLTSTSTTSYIFNKTGTKSTSLFVQDANGCTSLSSAIKTIKVNGSDAISFTANGRNFYSCDNTIDFQNTSTISNAVYTWDFGDGTTSTEASPGIHTYSNAGVYKVSLSANISGNSACNPKIVNTVYVGTSNVDINLASSICTNTTYSLSATSSISGFINIAKDYQWILPNGSNVNGDSTTISFSQAGTYTVQVKNLNGCQSVFAKTITVKSAPQFNLDITPNAGICTTTPVTFTLTSSDNISKYKFDFGDNKSDSTSGLSQEHIYTSGGAYAPTITVSNSQGCSLTQSASISVLTKCIDNGAGSVYNNVFGFSSECDSKNVVTFTNKNPAKPFKSIVIDANPYSFTGNSLTVTLPSKAKDATYSVQIIFADGTLDILREIQIMDETAAFSFINNDNANKYCAQNNFTFTVDPSVNQTNVSNYSWVIKDTKTNDIIYQNSNAGLTSINILIPSASTYSATLEIYDKRTTPCVSSITKAFTTLGIVSDFAAVGDSSFCTPKGNISLKDKSIYGANMATSIRWDLGDGTIQDYTNSNYTNTIQHSYNYVGNASLVTYPVTLRITEANGCISSLTRNDVFKFYNGQVNFYTPDTILCNSNTINIKNQSNISDLQTNGFTWTVGNITQTNSDYSDFNTTINDKIFPSYYTVKLKAIFGTNITCSTEVSREKYIQFIKPVAKFEILNENLINTCPPYTLQLHNQSTGYQDLTWTFNETTTNTSTLDTLLFSVSKPDNYTISLKLDGYDNCNDSKEFEFRAIGPMGTMSSDISRGCMPLGVNLKVNSNDAIVNYLWNLDDGNSYNQESPDYFNYTYSSGGTFNPTVTILGRPEDGSCTNVLSLVSPITVDQRINLAYQPNYTFCLGDTSTSKGVEIEVSHKAATTLQWTANPADQINALSSTTDSIVYAKQLSTTVYNIHATSLNTCPDEEGQITVTTRQSPIISVPTKNITVAAGEYFYLNPQVVDNSNSLIYRWTPEFRLSNAYILNPQAISDIDTTYYLNVQNQYGCSTSDSINVKVLCSQSKILMANGFTPNGDGKNDRFYVSGYGIKNVKHFIIFDRWGKRVFERNNISANDFNQGWDGTYNGNQLETGTYLYIAELTCSEGTDYTTKGSVVLIR